MTSFLPKRYFERLVEKSNDRTKSWSISFWNQLLVLIFGQLDGCNSLRELTDITIAHSSKSYHLGFGKTPITRSTLSKANMLRDYRVFESFAYHMVNLAQQMTSFLPKRYFERLVEKSNDRTKSWSISFWNQLLVLIFGQLDGCNSLRELTDITIAHSSKSYHLGFGKTPITRSTLSKANMLRNYRVFESFAYHMVNLAQQKRIDKEFDLNGTFYAFDSTTIDLCLSLYDWARFRSTKSGIKVHTQLDIRTEISTSFTITDAVVHDVNAMDSIAYEPFACYIFDRGYFDLRRLYHINEVSSFFVIREKRRPKYEITAGEDVLEGTDNVLQDQTIRFTGKRNCTNYPSEIRRIVYYSPEMNRTFTYYTNNFYLKASDIALLYKNRH